MVVFESKNSFEFDTVMLMRSERLKLSYIQKIICDLLWENVH